MNIQATIDFLPFTSDADAAIVVPFHNRAFEEMHPRRMHVTTDEFRGRYMNSRTERSFFGIMDTEGELAALGQSVRWIDGTNAELTFIQNLVRPDLRQQGLGRSILRRALEIADEHGRTILTADTVDTVPPGVAFAEKVGANLSIREHINIVAVEDLDIAMLERWRDEGPVRAASYELLPWIDGYPEEHHGQIARLFVMADEDMPFEDASFEPQAETAESVKEDLDRSAGTVERITSVIRHIESGDIVGFSELLMLHKGNPTLNTTLTAVNRDHRGHAIGKWIKADAILRGIERYPDATHIQTENAFSNAPMLGINNAIGFEPEHTVLSYEATADRVRAYLDRS